MSLSRAISLSLLVTVSQLLLLSIEFAHVSSFIQPSSRKSLTQPLVGKPNDFTSRIPCRLTSEPTEGNAEITKQLERAKAALAVSRAKMEAQEQAEAGIIGEAAEERNEDKQVPFFAMNTVDEDVKKEQVIKDKNEDGLFTTDGDLMAKLSEEEEWESRSLFEVFKNEKEKTPDAMNIDRDIGQSMYNLRKSLQTEDFRTIFDKRNRFIGEA